MSISNETNPFDSSEQTPSLAELSCEAMDSMLQSVNIQTEELPHRQRRISASLQIPHSPESVWQVLSDYDSLPSFIPNLASSKRLARPEGGIRLEQIGTQKLLRINFSARVVLDMEESFPHEIRFKMVEGDFKEFSGHWQLNPISAGSPDNEYQSSTGTQLLYSVLVWPKRTMPVRLIENRICKDLRINLLAIRAQVIHTFGHPTEELA